MSQKESSPLILIVITILAGIGWAIFILLFTILWSTNFSLFQNIVIILISLFIVGGLIGLMWVIWGFRVKKQSAS